MAYRLWPKGRSSFENAIAELALVIERTGQFALFTDGERRYSTTLFEICCEVVRTGKPGRPKTTLAKGVVVRLKNKGTRSHTPGKKPKKIQMPKPEHPETANEVEDSEVHANHLEAFNAALRRKCAAFRRKCNTYAKSTRTLQSRLDLFWCLHNFVRKHFTTQNVPAQQIGIIQEPLSLEGLMRMHLPN